MIRRIALGTFVVLGLALQAGAGQAQIAAVRLTPPQIAALAKGGAGAGTSGISGIQTSVLAGDPTKPGLYAIEIRVPAHTRIAAHRHRDSRTAVVVSGQWNLGYAETASEAAGQALPPGSFYTEPGGVAHFAWTGDQPAVVYITGYGPTDTTYVDPAAAPPPP